MHPVHAPAHVAAVDRHHHGVLRAVRQGDHRRDEEEGAQAGQARPRGGLRRIRGAEGPHGGCREVLVSVG